MDKMYLLILLIGCVSCFDLPADWINPSDLHHSRKVGDLFPETKVPYKSENLPPEKEVAADESKSVLQNATSICPPQNYRLPEADKRIVMITLYFTSKNLEILHAYASSETYETFSWSDFDQAFSSLFEVPEVTVTTEESTGPQQDNTLFIFVSIVGGMLIAGLWILLKSGSIFKACWVVVVMNFCCALVWNLFKAYNIEKQKILKSLGTDLKIPSWWESIQLYGSNKQDDLLTQNHPMFNINFGEVVVETLGSVFHFLPILGEKSGHMVANFYGSQNWLIRWVVQPLQLLFNPIFFLIFLLLIVIVMTGFTIKLPFFTLETNKRSEPQQVERGAHQQPQQHIAAAAGHPHAAAIEEEIFLAGPSRGPVRLKRGEYIAAEPLLGSTNQRLPALTCTRKGPWKGSIVRYGYIKKRIVSGRNKEEFQS
uniref:Chloride channel CLIC-like protein 1 n=1 Tax=Rhodnius prolixus TaxID=13249 RepID=T1IAG3_RHOPR